MPETYQGISSDFKRLTEQMEDTRIVLFSAVHTIRIDYRGHGKVVRRAESLYKMSVDFKSGLEEYIRIFSKLKPVAIF